MFYFAYGQNMFHRQMKKRCPDSRFLSRGCLEDYRFVYDGRSFSRLVSVANIVPSRGGKVWGAIFEISQKDLALLDTFEGYEHKVYKRAVFSIRDDRGNVLDCIAYYRSGEPIGTPSEKYRKFVLAGAAECGLPEDYVRENLEKAVK